MPLFGKRNKTQTQQEEAPAEESQQKSAAGGEKAVGGGKEPRRQFAPTEVLRRPRVTEKATTLAERNVYVFNVDPRANKTLIRSAVQELYGVTPVKVNTVPIRSKRVFARGIPGKRAGGKKAYVYLREGDRIDTV